MKPEELRRVLHDPVAKRLYESVGLARLAYTVKDGSPRVVPIGFEWNGSAFVVCTATIAPKVAALNADPRVALTIDTNEFPPNVLLVRGTASVEIVDGIPEEFLRMSRQTMSEEQYEEWKPGVEGFYEQMARIEITPNWAKVLDFDTRLPSAVEELAERAARR